MAYGTTIAFIGLGMMGLPMASRLITAGFIVHGADLSPEALKTLSLRGGHAVATPYQAALNADIVICMLPNASIVREALLGEGGAAHVLKTGSIVIDMSSSDPLQTRKLHDELLGRGIKLIDAPVSGGVRKASDGTLAIMVGGDADAIEIARPLFEVLGDKVFEVGPIGAGHAMKALNNYVSAAGLVAACEALAVGQQFGLEPERLVDILNVSTGRNNSTEVKLKPFVLSGTFAGGFAMNLMAKDLRTAAHLADELGLAADGIRSMAQLWTKASQDLGSAADHTEIAKVVGKKNP